MFNSLSGIVLIYLVCALLSAVLLLTYIFISRAKNPYFILLYTLIFLVNLGYFGIAVTNNLEFALMSNRIAYLGSVFLPLVMLLIISDVLKIKIGKSVKIILFALGLGVFLVTASQGIFEIYYKAVALETFDGASKLIKEYGPLHGSYVFYILGYFIAMIAIVSVAFTKKRMTRLAHSFLLTVSVFLNIFVWFSEKFFDNNFEFLSVSYIISGVFIWGLYSAMNENESLLHQIEEQKMIQAVSEKNDIEKDMIREEFLSGMGRLTTTERYIFNYYLEGKTTREILSLLGITENTLKFHNKNIYSKLNVSSRKKLVELANEFEITSF
ncbi:MAG: hypothetical protein IKJ91_07860 [Clostridia bacterium]|nr:hypothetical protein [Clostridia bacterium]